MAHSVYMVVNLSLPVVIDVVGTARFGDSQTPNAWVILAKSQCRICTDLYLFLLIYIELSVLRSVEIKEVRHSWSCNYYRRIGKDRTRVGTFDVFILARVASRMLAAIFLASKLQPVNSKRLRP